MTYNLGGHEIGGQIIIKENPRTKWICRGCRSPVIKPKVKNGRECCPFCGKEKKD